MNRFEEVKRLKELEEKAKANLPGSRIFFREHMAHAAPWLLHVAEAFRPGDAAEITATIEFLEFMADLGPCRYTGHDGKIAVLRRLQAACEEMER